MCFQGINHQILGFASETSKKHILHRFPLSWCIFSIPKLENQLKHTQHLHPQTLQSDFFRGDGRGIQIPKTTFVLKEGHDFQHHDLGLEKTEHTQVMAFYPGCCNIYWNCCPARWFPQLHVEKAHEGSLTIDPILNRSNLRYLHQLSDSKLGHHL